MIIRLRTIVPLVLLAVVCHGQKTNLLSGNWNNGLNWLPLGVPGAGDDVQIANGTTVSITSTAVCNNLTVGTGGSAGLEFSGGARSFTVNGNLLVNSGATFAAPLSSNSTHSLVISGNITNNGVFQMFSDNNSRAFVHFV